MNTSITSPTVRSSEILFQQRAAFLREGPPSLSQRRADLKKLRSAILARRTEIETVLNTDFGHRSRYETAIMEIAALVQGIDYLQRNLRSFMRPTRRHVALKPLATAIAAGNRAMIKPSECTPATSDLLARMLAGAFALEQVAVVTGD